MRPEGAKAATEELLPLLLPLRGVSYAFRPTQGAAPFGRSALGWGLAPPSGVSLPAGNQKSSALAASAGEIIAAGFDISDLGDGSFAINALPAGTETLNATELLKDVLAETDGKTGIKEEMDKHIALVLARHAAISVGSELGDKELCGTIAELFATSSPKHTPDGNLVVAIIPEEKIEGWYSEFVGR